MILSKRFKVLARSCGVSKIKGSIIDILMHIKSAINKDSKFKKVFSKLCGYSGGWLLHSLAFMELYILCIGWKVVADLEDPVAVAESIENKF